LTLGSIVTVGVIVNQKPITVIIGPANAQNTCHDFHTLWCMDDFPLFCGGGDAISSIFGGVLPADAIAAVWLGLMVGARLLAGLTAFCFAKFPCFRPRPFPMALC
jgi:hypothetical protein